MSGPAVGSKGQIGFGEESTWGTAVTVDKFVEFTTESLSMEISGVLSKAIRAIRGYTKRKLTTKAVGGDVNIEVVPSGEFGTLLKHALGTASTAGSGPYTHTISAHTSLPTGLTFEVGRDVARFVYAGSKINTLSMSFSPGEILTSTFGVISKTETGDETTPQTASYDSVEPFTGVEASLTVAGSSQGVLSAQFSLNNNLYTGKYELGSDDLAKLVEQDRTVEGSMTVEFDDLTLYNLFANGTYAELVITCTSDEIAGGATPYSMTLTFPRIQYTGTTPTIGGPGIITVDCPFTALYDAANSDPELTITLVNADSSI